MSSLEKSSLPQSNRFIAGNCLVVTPLTIAFSFLALAIALLILDLLLPSAGILLALSLLCAIAADIFAFRSSSTAGIWMLIGELALIPVSALVFAKWWALTPIGKRMIIDTPVSKPFRWEESQLVGKLGVAIEDFLPTGRVDIDGKLYDAMGRGETIKKDQLVRVVSEEMGQLFVVPKELSPTHVNKESKVDGADDTDAKDPNDRINAPAQDLGLQSLD